MNEYWSKDDVIENAFLDLQHERDDLRAELARRNEELALTEKKLCNIDRLARAEIARRDEIISRLKEDAERLDKRAITYVYLEDTPPYYECQLCFHDADEPDNILHDTDCPITLHRALIEELELGDVK